MKHSFKDLLSSPKLLRKAVEKELKNNPWCVTATAESNKRIVRVVEQNDYLIILVDIKQSSETGTEDRMFPISGLTYEQRKVIARRVLKSNDDGLPPDWEGIIAPMKNGVWYTELYDVKVMHPMADRI